MKLRILVLAVLIATVGSLAIAEEDAPAMRTTAEVLKDLKSAEPAVRLGTIDEARKDQDKAITNQLLKLVKDKDPSVRLASVEALGDRTEKPARRSAAMTLSSRLSSLTGKLAYEEEYRATIKSLHDLAQPCAIKALMDFAVEEPQETSRARLLAVGNTPAKEAIDVLIAFASKGRQRGRNNQRQFAIEALRYATGQKHGNDPDRWRDWWRDVESDWDFERAAADRDAERQRQREKIERQEEKRRRAEEKRANRERRKNEGAGG